MRAKSQQAGSSEIEAKEKLIVYVYDYLKNSNAPQAAQTFLEEINYNRDIKFTVDGPGFLTNWWCVFWDLYCAASDKKGHVDASNEARAFHEYNMRSVMSPSCAQTSPPQPGPPYMGGGMMTGPRYGPPPPHGGPIRGPMNVGPRMQGMGQPGPPHPMGVPHPPMMGAASPRYAPHPGHMTPGSSTSSGPGIGPEPGPSPGINRMTPNHSSSPRPQVGPPNGMGQMSGPLSGPHGGPPPGQPMSSGGPQMQQRGGMPPQPWQNNFNVNSPADQQCFMSGPPVSSSQQNDFGGMMMNDGSGMMDVKSGPNTSGPPNQQQEEYVMPGPYGQQGDHGEGSEIMRLKESLENNTKDYNESDQNGPFGSMDFVP